MKARFVAGVLLGILGRAAAGAQEDAPLPQRPVGRADRTEAAAGPLGEDEKIVHFLSRFTPGPTEELFREVRGVGIGRWLEEQLRGDLRESETFAEHLRRFETIGLSSRDIVRRYKVPDDDARQAIPGKELGAWVLARAVYSRRHVREVAADFFRNHFSVSLDKDDVKFLATEWEREVIRDLCLGSFGELLEATARHPAMLVYLDNFISRAPPPPAELKTLERQVLRKTGSAEEARQAVNIARQRGLNENYARELMELHTLGVDRYYTQADVVAVAKCLTGWTLDPGKWTFLYRPDLHCLERKTVLGRPVAPKGRNDSEGDVVLEMLKLHPGTAQFVSWKLCRHLVNDEPDPALVKRVAAVFRSARGNLARVFQAIASDPEFYERRNFRDKYKRPFEFVVSALRATGARLEHYDGILDALAKMNEALYRCPDPTGYYDQAEAWRDPGAIATRWVFARDLASGRIPGVKIPDAFYDDLDPARPESWTATLAGKMLPALRLSPATARKLEELARRHAGAPREAGPRMTAVLLGSPEFQRQ